MKKHISFSEFKNWSTCAYYHKLTYIDSLKMFQGNEHTAFGTAMHSVYEHTLLQGSKGAENFFDHSFLQQLQELHEKNLSLDKGLLLSMREQGKKLAPLAGDALKEHFGNFKVISTEEMLYETIDEEVEESLYFKGYIDVVLQTDDGKYHVIDWKTCSWGWPTRKKSDKILSYQLTFYKHFFAKKYDIDPDLIETYFALVKRTAKKDNIEIFKVSSGRKKVQNALNILHRTIYNIKHKKYIKNRLSCSRCEFYKTEYCT